MPRSRQGDREFSPRYAGGGNRTQIRDRELAFRIGINSGPVVAGVIGRKKFIYDLWGDAVNIASLMESQGQSQSIQITSNTFRLLKDEFVCEAKGTIKEKGGDQLEVWHVLGRKVT